jgi:hypothetical protein
MGEAKNRRNKKQKFLSTHPYCIYCGDLATTTDHCPPRCFFAERKWPETYEFPCCEPCNREVAQDEQVCAVLVRIRPEKDYDADERYREEWEKLMRGVAVNRPDLIEEWRSTSATSNKRFYRTAFGPEQGDYLRHEGWGSITVGKKTNEVLKRFLIKFAKAIYYKHLNELFDGSIAMAHIDPFSPEGQDQLASALKISPKLAIPERGNKSLADQFVYRYNHDTKLGVIHAVVEFNPQLRFQIMASRTELAERLKEDWRKRGMKISDQLVIDVPLKHPHVNRKLEIL